ncbi:hypothetical protein AAFF_G00312010 [Aldrovandia affinis]|uniref:Ribosomal protein S14 n=1 Tax=Aldrovandia affinis TaxID=143900 RepID=A0AAD7WRK6_9TELE|nr:hypothetical protein AAFF_G00312010 [Aldrovandia affinis]
MERGSQSPQWGCKALLKKRTDGFSLTAVGCEKHRAINMPPVMTLTSYPGLISPFTENAVNRQPAHVAVEAAQQSIQQYSVPATDLKYPAAPRPYQEAMEGGISQPRRQHITMAPRKGKEKKEEQVISLGPQVAEGENVFGVCHIFASFNDTFVHVTDLSGKETICRVTGRGTEVQGTGHHRPTHQTPSHRGQQDQDSWTGAQSALRALARSGMKIGRIEDVTPIPSDSTRRKGGRRGRRL